MVVTTRQEAYITENVNTHYTEINMKELIAQ